MSNRIVLSLALAFTVSICAHRADAGMSGASERAHLQSVSQTQAALQPPEAAPRTQARPVAPARARVAPPAPVGHALGDFNGTWRIVASPGCGLLGRSLVRVSHGQVVGLGLRGNVGPTGHVRTVGRSFGRSVVSTGRVGGSFGSGTYRVSTGCSGTWLAQRL